MLKRRPEDLVTCDDPHERSAELGHVERPVDLDNRLRGAARPVGLDRPGELLLGGEPEAHRFFLHVLAFRHRAFGESATASPICNAPTFRCY